MYAEENHQKITKTRSLSEQQLCYTHTDTVRGHTNRTYIWLLTIVYLSTIQQDSKNKLQEVDVYLLQKLGTFTMLNSESYPYKKTLVKFMNGYVKIVISKNFLSQDSVNFKRLL